MPSRPMKAGELNKRVLIQELDDTTDTHGGKGGTPTYTTVATWSVAIVPLRGRELEEAQKVNTRATTKIVMRRFAGLTEKHRLVYTEEA